MITRAIALITYELMIEQHRQERMQMNKDSGKYEDFDIDVKNDPESGYRWIRTGGIGVVF